MATNKKKKSEYDIQVRFSDLNQDEYYNLIESLKEDIINDFLSKDNKVLLIIDGIDDYEEYDKTLETTEYEIEFLKGNLLTYLILLRPFIIYKVPVHSKFIREITTVEEMNSFLNDLIRFFAEVFEVLIGEEVKDIISELNIIGSNILGSYGLTINLYDIIHLIRENEDFANLIGFKVNNIDKKLGFKEILNILKEKTNEMIDILKNTDNCYNILLKSGSGINTLQLRECLLNIGCKADNNERIISEVIDTSYLRGLDPFQFFVDCNGGRKALLINFRKTKDSGYFTRKTTYENIDVRLMEDVDDCGTKGTLRTFIDSQKTINKLVWRYFYLDNDDSLYQFVPDEDYSELIGTFINLRSPIKCACQYGVCKTCYGGLWKYVKGKNIGITGMYILNNQNTQLSLSAKHHLQASVNEIKWSKEFEEFFSVDKDNITLNENHKKSFKFTIDELIVDENNYDDSNKFNSITIIDTNNTFKIDLPKTLYINEDVISDLESHYDIGNDNYLFNSKEFKSEDIIFNYTMENNALMASLNNITNLLDTNSYIAEHTIDETFNKMIQILNDSPLIIHFVHMEILLREMCKIEEDDRGLFMFDYDPIIKIQRLTEALIRNKSLGKSLSMQEQYNQLTRSIDTYEKDYPSHFDQFII